MASKQRSDNPHPHLRFPDGGPWWWACSAPERPHDVWACYAAAECAPCSIALDALARRSPDVYMEERNPETGAWLRSYDAEIASRELQPSGE